MLVLSRTAGEALLIGANVVVRVLAVEGSKVQLGIEADEEVIVLRAELTSQTERAE